MRFPVLLLLCGCMASTAAHSAGPDDGRERGRTAGCGVAATNEGTFNSIVLPVLGRDRIYHLRIPNKYDASHAYPLIFRWHGRGGDGLSGGLDIELDSGDDAFVVGADGLNNTWSPGTNADDLAFFDGMLEAIEKRYCIDRNRVFSYGFSAGGYFTNNLACERGDVLRASAAVASGPRGGVCRGKAAAWFLHDADDDAVPIAQGRAARDRALAANGCSADTIDEGEGCVRYRGCEAEPIVWCQSTGFGHNIRGDFAPARVWKFFLGLH